MATLKGSFPASKPGGKAGKGKAAAPAQVAVTDSAEQEHQRVADELKRFDFDSRYGPYLGMTRIQRWERAAANGLLPPPHIKELLADGDERLKWSVLENLLTTRPLTPS